MTNEPQKESINSSLFFLHSIVPEIHYRQCGADICTVFSILDRSDLQGPLVVAVSCRMSRGWQRGAHGRLTVVSIGAAVVAAA